MIAAAACCAQTNNQGTPIEQAALSNNVQLLIGGSTNVVVRGSDPRFWASVRNKSTNTIAIYVSGDPFSDFQVSLTDEGGKIHTLKQKEPIHMVNGNHLSRIAPNGSVEFPLPLGNAMVDLKPGNYRLEVKGSYSIPSNQTPGKSQMHKIISNETPLILR